MTEDNNKITIILALGLIGVAIGLLFLLKNSMTTQTTLSQLQQLSRTPNLLYNGLNNLSNLTYQNYNNEMWNVIRDENGNLLNIERKPDTITNTSTPSKISNLTDTSNPIITK